MSIQKHAKVSFPNEPVSHLSNRILHILNVFINHFYAPHALRFIFSKHCNNKVFFPIAALQLFTISIYENKH